MPTIVRHFCGSIMQSLWQFYLQFVLERVSLTLYFDKTSKLPVHNLSWSYLQIQLVYRTPRLMNMSLWVVASQTQAPNENPRYLYEDTIFSTLWIRKVSKMFTSTWGGGLFVVFFFSCHAKNSLQKSVVFIQNHMNKEKLKVSSHTRIL